MQKDSLKDGMGEFKFTDDLALLNSEIDKCRAETKLIRRSLLISVGLLIVLFAFVYYVSNYQIPFEQLQKFFVEGIPIVFLTGLFTLVMGGIMFFLSRRISQLEGLADQIEQQIDRLKKLIESK